MDNFELISFHDADALAKTVADRFLTEVAGKTATPYCVALSGGRIGGRLLAFAAVQSEPKALSSAHFFWADERCVPPDDPASNFGIARDLLLAPLQVKPDRIHRIRGEIAPDWAAAEAEAELCRIAAMNSAGQPVLDLILLGMGEDGHVASLFPAAPVQLPASKAVYLPVMAPKPPPERISINYPTIAAARQTWVLASGPGKEAAFEESLSGGGKTPLAKVLRLRERTLIFTDINLQVPQ
jgi:6-phosphogluconolactonase